ncbi:hypothetical protein RHMOL_Rhmol10G0110100 [Rhododendron molle]|nr:hypothetical protein RHMOL_Rhmol10G0110100 [Rhododendron molle]
MLIVILIPILIVSINFPWLPQLTGFEGIVIEGSFKRLVCLLKLWRPRLLKKSKAAYACGRTLSVAMLIGFLLYPGTLILGFSVICNYSVSWFFFS